MWRLIGQATSRDNGQAWTWLPITRLIRWQRACVAPTCPRHAVTSRNRRLLC